MHIRIRAKKYFLGIKTRVIGQWILISTLVLSTPNSVVVLNDNIVVLSGNAK